MAFVRRAHGWRSHTLSNGCGCLSCNVIMILPGSKGGSCELAGTPVLASARTGNSCAEAALRGSPGGAAVVADCCAADGAGGAGTAAVAAGVGDGRLGALPEPAGCCVGEASTTLGAAVETDDAGAAVLAADGDAPTHALPTGAAAVRAAVVVVEGSDCCEEEAAKPAEFINKELAG